MSGRWWLRPAAPEDGTAVGALFTASFALLDFLPKLHSAEEDRLFFQGVVLAERVTLAESDAGLLGFLGETEGWVNHLYVHPDHLGRGVGSALLRHAQSHQESLQLWCFQKNRRGRRFYEARGFRAQRFTDGARNEEREPDILYAWRRAGAVRPKMR